MTLVRLVWLCFSEELKSAEEVKAAMSKRVTELEEDNATWGRVKNSLQEQLQKAEKKMSEAQELHDSELCQAKMQCCLFEQQFQKAKVGVMSFLRITMFYL